MTPTQRNLKEDAFETEVYKLLGSMHGYRLRSEKQNDSMYGWVNPAYDVANALDHELLVEFLEATQQEELMKLKDIYADWKEQLISRLDKKMAEKGIVHIFKNKLEIGLIKFDMAYFRPATGRNLETQSLYEANIFSVMRQVQYTLANKKSLDLCLFLNGIPIATCELKNELTGQNVNHAENQYKRDRAPSEKLFSFKRCFGHFAVDTSLVSVTTKIASWGTYFLPINKGVNEGAGNPPVENAHKTHYLWEDVWSPDSWLEIIGNFAHVFVEVTEDDNGKERQKEILIYPRYHQRDTVRRIVDSCAEQGPGKNYLVQHSAGSGKSMTIAWTAFRLAELHDTNDKKVYDSIIILTDRRVLDRQLRETIRAFEPTRGFLKAIGERETPTAQYLRKALEDGAQVITSTIQKFPVILDSVGDLPGKSFAIIVDEAHSSMSGEMKRMVQEVLGEAKEGEEYTIDDWATLQAQQRQQPANLSYFAFTATPKRKTLELFGEPNGKDGFKPFSLYSMRQAIEEKFILDVVKEYTTYRTFFKLLEDTTSEGVMVPRNKALSKILQYVDLHETSLRQKIEIIVEHFNAVVRDNVNGQAKSMIVTKSIEAAIQYGLALREYLKEKGYEDKVLIAFSGSKKVDGHTYTEPEINDGLSETKTGTEFNKPGYRYLVVAEKFQTGFDQPKLSAMYVDKVLSGVNAVQTLSRLNRRASGKEGVFVLDFRNTADKIKKAFDPFYKATIISESTDINAINDLREILLGIYNIRQTDIDEFISIIDPRDSDIHGPANGILDMVTEEIKSLTDEEYEAFRAAGYDYIMRYPFLAQVVGYVDVDAEKLFVFVKYLLKKLSTRRVDPPLQISEWLDLNALRVIKKGAGAILLEGNEEPGGERDPSGGRGVILDQEEDSLIKIIKDVNGKWGAEFGPEQEKNLNKMSEDLTENEDFQNVMKNNAQRNTRLRFDELFKGKVHEQYTNDPKLWNILTESEEMQRYIRLRMFEIVKRDIMADTDK
jgi:type I restriction enzyme, R subunit